MFNTKSLAQLFNGKPETVLLSVIIDLTKAYLAKAQKLELRKHRVKLKIEDH